MSSKSLDSSTATLKPFNKLKRSDLDAAPVWVWVTDANEGTTEEGGEPDESSIEPTTLDRIPLGGFAQFIVACRITLKDRSEYPGLAEVTVAEGRVAVAPVVVFLLDRQLRIPAVETNRLLAKYTKTVENYPTAWQLSVAVEQEPAPRGGKIRGADMKNVVAAGIEILKALKALRK